MAGSSLAMRARQILKTLDEVAQKNGRDPHKIQLLAVSKGQPVEVIRQAMALGFKCFGENYVQEWEEKSSQLSQTQLEWHFIGHLQSNKVKSVVGRMALIHSVDRYKLAEIISQQAVALGIKQKILIEVRLANETTKSGISPSDFEQEWTQWSSLPGLNLSGLMVLPPLTEDPESSRPYFRQACEWFQKWKLLLGESHSWNHLSMGTSQDFVVALEEGATILRVGVAMFGPRLK